MTLKRITQEYNYLIASPTPGISVGRQGEDMFNYWAKIDGPENTPYIGGVFDLDIHFPQTYPFGPFEITFKTKIYHPNIDDQGQIQCEDLKHMWSPAFTLDWILQTISQLLVIPNTAEEALVPEIAEVYRTDRDKFDATAFEWTLKYAVN